MDSSRLDTPNVEPDKRTTTFPLLEDVEKRLKMDKIDNESLANLIRSITEEIMSSVSDELKKEISLCRAEVIRLRKDIEGKDQEIESLKDRVDHLEQYGRRENIRINGIPEMEDKNTTQVVLKLGEVIKADLFEDHINSSHRMGRKRDHPRPIICHFHSTNEKDRVMTMKKKLKEVDTVKFFGAEKIFINEDLTKARADVVSAARRMKKERKIEDTWTRKGVIFMRKNGHVSKVTTMKQLSSNS